MSNCLEVRLSWFRQLKVTFLVRTKEEGGRRQAWNDLTAFEVRHLFWSQWEVWIRGWRLSYLGLNSLPMATEQKKVNIVINGSMRREKTPVAPGSWEEDGHGVDVWVFRVRHFMVSSVSILAGMCDL